MSICAATQPLTTFTASNTSAIQPRPRVISPRNFLFLIPTITGIALGLLFLPNFGLGLVVGMCGFVFNTISVNVLVNMGVFKYYDEKNSKYNHLIQNSLVSTSLYVPIAEEGMYRGCMHPLLTTSIQILVPATATALFGTTLSVATGVSIVATSVLFGAMHYLNSHKNVHLQATVNTVNGLVWGILTSLFGIGASMGAHIANNSFPSFLDALSRSDNCRAIVHRHKQFNVLNLPT